jgi:hypothetical protein
MGGGGGGGGTIWGWGGMLRPGDGNGDGGDCNPLAEGATCPNETFQPTPDPANPFAYPQFPLGGSLAYPSCTAPE